MIRLLLLVLIPCGILSASALFSCENPPPTCAEPVEYDSVLTRHFTYQILDHDTLKLDLYQKSNEIKPLVLFVHGGGFGGGNHDHPFIAQFCDSLAQTGVHVASMSYRLTLQGQTFDCDQTIENKLTAFRECVKDIRQATAFCMDKAKEMEINSEIILCGSSAGAEAGIHQLFWEHDEPKMDENPLDSSFQYRAFISMAGAIVDTTLISTEKAIPTLLFHGVCDPLVPICSDIHHYCPADAPGALFLHGSISISERLTSLGSPHWCVIECGGDHSIANRAMTDHFDFIANFIRDVLAERLTESRFEKIENGSCMETRCPVCD